jgi:hypothetical protein
MSIPTSFFCDQFFLSQRHDAFIFHFMNPANFSTHQQQTFIIFYSIILRTATTATTATATATTTATATATATTTMPPLSVSNATVTELFKGNAKFGRPSEKEGGGWIVTAGKGDVMIQKQINQDGSVVIVVRWANYMGLDGMNGRILPGLPIQRGNNSKEVYFKTSSTTTRGARHKAPFVFKFETVDEAEVFEALWLLKNGSIAAWKEQDTKKKEGTNNTSIVPLQDKTNAASTPARKRKAGPMVDGSLRKKSKDADHLLNTIGGGDSNVDGNVPTLCDGLVNDDDDDDVSDPCVVGAFKTVGLLPTEVNVNGKLRKIVKVKRSILKSVAEHSFDNSNGEDGVDFKKDNSEDLNDDDSNDDSSDDSSGEDVIIDELDAPQSQNWTTAFAS